MLILEFAILFLSYYFGFRAFFDPRDDFEFLLARWWILLIGISVIFGWSSHLI